MKLQPNTSAINNNTLHTINQEEERPGFISNSSSNQSLSSPRRSVQEDSTRWLRGQKITVPSQCHGKCKHAFLSLNTGDWSFPYTGRYIGYISF